MQPDEEKDSRRLPLSTRRVKGGVTEHFRELRMGAFELRGLGSTAVASRPHLEKLKSQAKTMEPPKQADVREGVAGHAASGMVRVGMQHVSVAPEPEMEHMGGGSQGPLRKDPQPPEPRNEHRVTRVGAKGRAGITAGGQAAITFQYPV